MHSMRFLCAQQLIHTGYSTITCMCIFLPPPYLHQTCTRMQPTYSLLLARINLQFLKHYPQRHAYLHAKFDLLMWCTCLLARIFAYLHGFNHSDSIPLTCVQCSDLLAQCIAYLHFYTTPTCIPTCIAYTHVHFSNFRLIRGFSDQLRTQGHNQYANHIFFIYVHSPVMLSTKNKLDQVDSALGPILLSN